jgi:hypothetical protein
MVRYCDATERAVLDRLNGTRRETAWSTRIALALIVSAALLMFLLIPGHAPEPGYPPASSCPTSSATP